MSGRVDPTHQPLLQAQYSANRRTPPVVWLGLRDLNKWKWTDGSRVAYTNWAPNEPESTIPRTRRSLAVAALWNRLTGAHRPQVVVRTGGRWGSDPGNCVAVYYMDARRSPNMPWRKKGQWKDDFCNQQYLYLCKSGKTTLQQNEQSVQDMEEVGAGKTTPQQDGKSRCLDMEEVVRPRRSKMESHGAWTWEKSVVKIRLLDMLLPFKERIYLFLKDLLPVSTKEENIGLNFTTDQLVATSSDCGSGLRSSDHPQCHLEDTETKVSILKTDQNPDVRARHPISLPDINYAYAGWDARDGQASLVSERRSSRPERQFVDGLNFCWDGSGLARMARDAAARASGMLSFLQTWLLSITTI
ncbi:hypothetical protein Bbelb_146670 [Branchiostoma belcheri]|nr:hypothetical protein Bbelb_146670 [Branchiostoma belcheri]